jgi:hypothetical protein
LKLQIVQDFYQHTLAKVTEWQTVT